MLAALLGAAPQAEQRPEIGAEQDLEVGGDDADDGEGVAVERDGAADEGGVAAEAGAPEALAQHNDGRTIAHVSRSEGPAGDRPDAEPVEELTGDRLSRDPLGRSRETGQRASASGHRG